MNNDKSNLSVVTKKYNRTEPRLRDEEREPQDKDIKDKEGTQPAKYFKGLKKTTKSKRDAHFKKNDGKRMLSFRRCWVRSWRAKHNRQTCYCW